MHAGKIEVGVERPQGPVQRVLYVEDEEDNFTVAELRLRKRYQLVWAKTDRQAVELLTASPRGYIAILMDIELQGVALNGIQLTRLLRGGLPTHERPGFAARLPIITAPIIYVTAYGSRYGERELLQTGANAVIIKPVNFLALSLAIATDAMRTP